MRLDPDPTRDAPPSARARPRARLLGLVAVLATLAAGCSGSATALADGADAPAEDATGAEPGPLTGELTVFAAASLQEALDELLADFGAAHPGVAIDAAVYDGSSTLVTQLAEGATADVLATANEATMSAATDAGIMTAGSHVFATNTLVIAVPADNPHGVADLPDVLGLAYAVCADQVPCGAATAQLFEAAGLAADPISVEQSVTAVANRVSSGDVDAGFVYATDVAARPELAGIAPAAASVVNSYPIGPTSHSPVGAAFIDFVLSEAGAAVLTEFGFGQP